MNEVDQDEIKNKDDKNDAGKNISTDENDSTENIDTEDETTKNKDEDQSSPDLKDQLLRALAEVENVRRRAKKDVADAGRYGIANFARDMLAVSDNMARALESIPDNAQEDNKTVKALVEGVEMTAREMSSALERHGVKQVNPMGMKFDYNMHQAMFEKPDSTEPHGTIIEVIQVGYMIGERLLRPAMVGVSKKSEEVMEED